jgi:hypothetical protein
MKINYHCPHCNGAINAENNIILSVKTVAGNTGLALLHEEIGNYAVSMSSSLVVEPGEIVDFFCPVCHASLNTTKGEHYAKYIRRDENNRDSVIVISRKYGDKCTFQIDDEKKILSYGECLSRFVDPEWFK